jgi:4-methyl-5(b-hydroxyethyl)-thiazole monophosphate biosynthesis
MIYLFLADGFEEIEALAPLDILRRAGKEVCMVGVTGKTVTGSHRIPVVCDVTAEEVDPDELPEAVILPGGMPGTKHLDGNMFVCAFTKAVCKNGGLVCAICAAPSVLGHIGILAGKRATCFPGFEAELIGATISADSVVRDGNVITAKGAGVALEFGFAIVAALCDEETAEKLAASMQCR